MDSINWKQKSFEGPPPAPEEEEDEVLLPAPMGRPAVGLIAVADPLAAVVACASVVTAPAAADP